MNRAERRRQMRAAGYEDSFSNGNGDGNPHVVIAYPHPHVIDAAFHTSLVMMLMYDRGRSRQVISDVLEHGSGPRVAAARNEICRVFLAHPQRPEWLWFIDADMAFAPNLLDQLLEVADAKDRPVIGGLCFIGGRGAKVSPTMYLLQPTETGFPRTETVVDYPADTVCKVDATGAACLLIHRSVLETVRSNHPGEAPWFCETSAPDGSVEYGEDITFCLRLAEAHIPLYVHTGAKTLHMKPAGIGEHSFRQYQDDIRSLGVDGAQAQWLERRGLNHNALGATKDGELRSAANDQPVEMVADGARL